MNRFGSCIGFFIVAFCVGSFNVIAMKRCVADLFTIQRPEYVKIENALLEEGADSALQQKLVVLLASSSLISDLINKEELLRILTGESQVAPLFNGVPFNVSYYSESLFDLYSNRIIEVLIRCFSKLRNSENDIESVKSSLKKIFAWLGCCRACIDLFNSDKVATNFGVCISRVGFQLSEPWNLSIPKPFRVFSLVRFRKYDFERAVNVANSPVKHEPASNDLKFIDPLIEILKARTLEERKKIRALLLRFVFDFSRSSTFIRGQASIMEWVYAAIAQMYGFDFIKGAYTQKDMDLLNECIENFPDEIFQTIREAYQKYFQASLAISNADNWLKCFSQIRVELRRCADSFGGAYRSLLEPKFCDFLLDVPCLILMQSGLDGRSIKLDKLNKALGLSFYEGYKKETIETLNEACNKFKGLRILSELPKCAAEARKILLNVPYHYDTKDTSIFATWGIILGHSIHILLEQILPQELSTSNISRSFLEVSINDLFTAWNKSFLEKLMGHMDVIAIDVEDFEIFCQIIKSITESENK